MYLCLAQVFSYSSVPPGSALSAGQVGRKVNSEAAARLGKLRGEIEELQQVGRRRS